MRLASLVVASAALLCLAPAGAAWAQAAQPSGEITLAAYASYYQDNFTKGVIEPFMQRHPAVKVTYFPQRTSAERLGTLRAQKDSPQIDVAIMDVIVARPAIAEGLFTALPPDKVPALAELDPRAKVAGEFGPALTFDSLALVFNREAFPDAPTSWRALWDPRAARKVVINAPPNIQGIALTIVATRMEGGDYMKSIDPGMTLLKTLAPSVQSWQASPDIYTLVTNGTAVLGVGWNAFSQLYKVQSAGKMDVVIPREGTVPQMDTINLVAGSKNQAAALAFIDYALGAEAQAALVKILHFAPVNPRAVVSPEDAAVTAATPEQRAAMIGVDWGFIADSRDRWLERWRREIIAAGR
jgi:putative spermidine/putrescine transport system substrate-binding protein